MEKLTKKQLKEISKSLGAYYCGGNVYNHENITYYLTHRQYKELEKYEKKDNDINELLKMLSSLLVGDIDNYYILDNMIAYSTCTFGNSGQLIRYTIKNKDNEIIREFYTYYC